MPDPKRNQIKDIYQHGAGLKYKVDGVILDATGYETGEEPKRVVLYTQLEAGKFPEGTLWVREEQDFLANFTKSLLRSRFTTVEFSL